MKWRAVLFQLLLRPISRGSTPALPAVAGLFTYGSTSPAPIPASGTVVAGLAGSIKVNPSVDPAQSGNPLLVRDGGISGNSAYKYNSSGGASYTDRIQQLIANLSSSQSFSASTQLQTTGSVSDYAKSSVSWLEALRQSSSNEAQARQTTADRAAQSLSQDTGVNLDEEMTNLLSLERTFQASSRLINTVDSMLSTLLQAAGG